MIYFLKTDHLSRRLWAVFLTSSSPDGCEGIPHSWSHSNFSLDITPCVSLFGWKIHKYLWPFTRMNCIYAYFSSIVLCLFKLFGLWQSFSNPTNIYGTWDSAVRDKGLQSKAVEHSNNIWAWVQILAPPVTHHGALGKLFNLSSVKMRIILLIL